MDSKDTLFILQITELVINGNFTLKQYSMLDLISILRCA